MLNQQAKVESDLLASETILRTVYGLTELPDMGADNPENWPYPFSIYKRYHQLNEALNQKNGNLTLEIIQDDDERYCYGVMQTSDTPQMFYLLELRCLKRLMEGSFRKGINQPAAATDLLLSIYAYVVQVLEMPSFADSSSCLHGEWFFLIENYQGQMLEERGEEKARLREMIGLVRGEIREGKQVMKELRKRVHLQKLKSRAEAFVPQTRLERQIARAARMVLRLQRRFPNKAFFDVFAYSSVFYNDDYTAQPDNRFGLVWDTQTDVYTDISHSMDAVLNECGQVVEPLQVQLLLPSKTGEKPRQYRPRFDHRFSKWTIALFSQLELINLTILPPLKKR